MPGVESLVQRVPQLINLVVVQVPVSVDSRSDLPMTQHPLEHVHVCPRTPNEARIRVTQVMQSHPAQVQAVEGAVPPRVTPPVIRVPTAPTTCPQHNRRIRVLVLLGPLSDTTL